MTDRRVSGGTRICGVIGDPIGHTLSPVMQNAAFRALGLDFIYVPFRVAGADLPAAVAGIRALNIAGINVTIPHKVAVMPLLDGLDPLAERIGAVNTIVNEGGRLTGSNTDAAGFLRALLEHGVAPEGREVAVLGAGGAARGIAYALAEKGARLTILNRWQELDWARQLAGRLAADFGREVAALELTGANLEKALDGAEVLINATSAGMSPDREETPVPAGLLRRGLVVFDIVYRPNRTRLLREAEAAGAATIGGLDMLAWQGALAFEKWTGQPAPVALMKEEARRAVAADED